MIVRVVLKRVSVTLIDGSFFSMDSPSSECHWPICEESTHTYTDQLVTSVVGKGKRDFGGAFSLPSSLKGSRRDLRKDGTGERGVLIWCAKREGERKSW